MFRDHRVEKGVREKRMKIYKEKIVQIDNTVLFLDHSASKVVFPRGTG